MNLEKLNLVELDAQEAVVTDGGTWWFDWLINVGGPSLPNHEYSWEKGQMS